MVHAVDFRQKKLLVGLGITTAGTLLAIVWCAWQGQVLHRGYPHNVYLYLPSHRFDDLTQVIHSAMRPSPYQDRLAGYLPSSYVAFRCLGSMTYAHAVYLYLTVTLLGLWLTLAVALRGMFDYSNRTLSATLSALIAATALIAVSYPVLMAVDRANVEFLLSLLVAGALLCFSQKRFNLGLLVLFPAICFKAFPMLLLVLFFRPRYYLRIAIVGLAFVAINFLCFSTFSPSLQTNWGLWQQNLAFCKEYYLIHNGGLGSSAALWTAWKGLVVTWHLALAGFPQHVTVALDDGDVSRMLEIFNYLVLLFIAFAVFHAIFIETRFFRRAIVLLLTMTLVIPFGGEYRLTYVDIAMVILILIRERRKYDLAVVGFLALAVIPKREIFLPYMGVSDTGQHDISIASLLTPPCILAAFCLLIASGTPANPGNQIKKRMVSDLQAVGQFWRRLRAWLAIIRSTGAGSADPRILFPS